MHPEEEATVHVPASRVSIAEVEDGFDDEFIDEDGDAPKGSKKREKERQKRRQLVYDEDAGVTIAKRRRKGGRKRGDWGDDSDF